MPQNRRASSELEAILYHLGYEIDMLLRVEDALVAVHKGEELHGERLQTIHNALLESFGIHARCLIDFLYRDSPMKPDDALAADFFDERTPWADTRLPKTPDLDAINSRVAKEIAHLTYHRTKQEPPDKNWNVPKIRDEIMDRVAQFFRSAPDSTISAENKENFHRIMQDTYGRDYGG